MTIKNYADVLRFAIQLQIRDAQDEVSHAESYEREQYLDGVVTGLRIALEKIDAADFLTE